MVFLKHGGVWLGNFLAGVLAMLGGWVVAVSEPDPFGSIGNLVGGGILVIVAVYIVRLMVKGSERVEAMWTNALEAASKRAEEAEARSARLQAENDELRQRIKEWSPHDSEG